MSKKTLIAVSIHCALAGYRRAGIALNKGDDNYDVTLDQLELLNADPRLLVQEPIETTLEQTSSPQDESETGNTLDSVDLDLSSAPEELAPFISVIHLLNQLEPLIKKPNCKDLEVLPEGMPETERFMPSAVQRDEAWDWYQENVVGK